MDINTNNFWEKQNKIGQQKVAERAENIDKYGIHVPDDVYEEMNKVIAYSENPEESAYRFGTAYQYSQMFDIPFSEAYEKQDEFNKALFGTDASKSARDAFTAVSDALEIGKNNVRLGELGNALRYATTLGDEENLKLIEEEIKLLNEDNKFREDNVPRMWVTEAFKVGFQSAPFTAVGMVAGTFGNFISPGAGLIAGATASANLMAGLEYLELRKNGASHDMANKLSIIMGGLEGVVEVALGKGLETLGAVGGAFGKKVIGERIRREVIEEITNAVGKRLHYGAFAKIASNIALRSVAGTLEEGGEEALQELLSIGGQALAAELENYDLPPEVADNIGKQTFEAFKGGILGSLVLGGLPVAGNTVASVKDYKTIKKAAETIESPEMFKDVAKNSKEGKRVFRGFSDDKKDAVIDQVFKEAQTARDKNHDEMYAEQKESYTYDEETSYTDEEGNEVEIEVTPEYRTENGELKTDIQTTTDEDGNTKGTFRIVDENNTQSYGHIDYTLDEETQTVTIDNFKMANKNRDVLRAETFDAFAQNMAGYKIEWNPVYSKAKGFKEYLSKNNPYGEKQGLNYYKDVNAVADVKTRKSVDKQLQENIKNLTARERSAAIVLLESAALKKGLGLTEYVNQTFNNGQIFGNLEEAQAMAQKQNGSDVKMQGAMLWRRFGAETRAVIYASEHSNFSTWAHELAHIWHDQLEGDLKTEAEKAFGVVNGDWRNTPFTFADGTVSTAAEGFARGFEDYLKTGKAPSNSLKKIFQDFAEFLARVYNGIKNFINMSPEITSVYDQLLQGDDSLLKLAEKAVIEQEIQNKLAQQRQKAEQEKQAQDQQKEERAVKEREIEEAQEEYDETEQLEDETVEEETTVEEEEITDTVQEDIINSLDATNKVDAQKVADILTDENASKETKETTALDSAGKNRDEEFAIFQLAGVNGIRNMAYSMKKKERLDALAVAKNMLEKASPLEGAKVTMQRIKWATGWDKNASGKWVYELDTSLFRIKNIGAFTKILQSEPQQLVRATDLTVDTILDAPELFEIYPLLRDIKVTFVNDYTGFRGGFGTNGIILNTRYIDKVNTEKGLKGVLVHEIQHAIQALEAAQSEDIKDKNNLVAIVENFRKVYAKLQQRQMNAGHFYDQDTDKFDASMQAYMNDELEIDARAVAKRTLLKSDERRHSIIANSSDVDITEKIVQQVIGVEGAQRLDEAYEVYERMDNYRIAREMELAGKSAKDIKLATGWERGVDAKWRYEINDITLNGEKLVENKFNYISGGFIEPLKNLINDGDLLKAYPALANINVVVTPYIDVSGSFSPADNTIKINKDLFEKYRENFSIEADEDGNILAIVEDDSFKSTLIHEIQHAIQRIEGFAKGGNVEQFKEEIEKRKPITKAQEKLVEDVDFYNKNVENKEQFTLLDFMKGQIKFDNKEGLYDDDFIKSYLLSEEDILVAYNQNKAKLEKFKKELKKEKSSYDKYYSLTREVEARNVQHRMHMDSEQRRETLLAETMDIAPEDQIVLFQKLVEAENKLINSIVFQEIKDEEEIARLEAEEKITAYRAMELIDGQLYPPMAGKVDGKLVNPLRIGSWIKADERPDLAQGKVNKRTGEIEYFFKLKKAGKDSKGKPIGDVLARYNPYWHASLSPLNDQFSTAYKRPTLVTVEVQIPKYELEGKYKAEKAKDSVGQVDWHSGEISSKLAEYGKPRQVILSQYNKVIRVVPDAEVAQKIKEQLEGTNIAIRDDLVTPNLAMELEKAGVPIEHTDIVKEFYNDSDNILFQELSDVRKQYENTDKWLKAPNGNDTNLTEKQWLQVRTPQFKAWFGDWENDPENASKVVDENGEPLVVYHGSGKWFNEFNDGKEIQHSKAPKGTIFATDNFDAAVSYVGYYGDKDPNSSKKVILDPDSPKHEKLWWGTYRRGGIYELFANIRNPYEVDYEGNLFKTEDGFYDVNEEVKWVLDHGEGKYDGLIIRNIKDYGLIDNKDIENAPAFTDIVGFNSNQFKSADQNKGTFDKNNPSILFQNDQSMYGIHNLSKEALEHAFKIGGLPNPSLAVTDKDLGFSSFGEISLIPYSLMLEKGNGNAGTFGADIYSPRYPSITRIVTDTGRNKVKSLFWAIENEELKREAISKTISSIEDRTRNIDLYRGLQLAYLEEKGIKDYYVYEKSNYSDEIKEKIKNLKTDNADDPETKRIVTDIVLAKKRAEDRVFAKMIANRELKEEKGNYTEEELEERIVEVLDYKMDFFKKENLDKDGLLSFRTVDDFIYDVKKEIRDAGKIDTYYTYQKATDYIKENNLTKDFEKWAKEQLAKVEIEEKIFNGYTPSGNIRYLDHTLENVSKWMKKQVLQGGEGFGYGLGSVRAQFTPKFHSLSEIKAEKGRLRNAADFEEIREEYNNRFYEIIKRLSGDNSYDVGAARFEEAFTSKDPIGYLEKEYGLNINSDFAEEMFKFAEDLKEMPTEYFETKYTRPVMLNEFAAAVVPSNLPQELKDKLEQEGLIVKEYTGDRQETINKALDEINEIRKVLFQTAYHGSPHNFDRFSTDSIGTGEGNQSFGWGLYFTNQEDIARYYADTVTGKSSQETPVFNNTMEYIRDEIGSGKNFEDIKEERLDFFYKKIEFLCENLNIGLTFDIKEVKDKTDWENDYSANSLISYIKAFNEIRKMEESDLHKRNLYTVELPDNGYLLWDKLYKEEIPAIMKALREEIEKDYSSGDAYIEWDLLEELESNNFTLSGKYLYDNISKLFYGNNKEKYASKYLRRIGYIGIDYPANSIAGHTDEGKRNYVIFDDEDVKVLEHLTYQTLDELYTDARDFDSWQSFMEVYEGWLKPEPSLVPENADASWYKATWEMAHGMVTEPDETLTKTDNPSAMSLDALFLMEIKKPGKLEEFLKNIHYLNTLNFDVMGEPIDEEDAAQREVQAQLQYFMRKSLTHGSWFSNAARVFNDKPLTDKARKTMLTLIEHSTRDYRDIYSELMGREDFAVPAEEKISTNIKLGLHGIEGANTDILSPEKRRQISEQIRNDEIAQKIKDGTMPMNDELDRYIKKLEKDTKEAEKKYDELKEATEQDYKRLSDWQQRQLIELQDEMLKARARYKNKSDETSRKINRGIKLTEQYLKEERAIKASYDKLFKQYSDLIKAQRLNADINDAIERRENWYRVKEDLKEKRDEKRVIEQIKKLRIQLVKRTMRRVPFNRVDFKSAKTLIAIQRIFEPNLFGGVNKWIGTEGSYLRAVWSSWQTDSEFREKTEKRLQKYKSGAKVIELLNNSKTVEDFNKWTSKERARLHRLLPKEDWIRELNLEDLAEERADSIQLDISTKEDVKYDANGKAYILTTPVMSDEVKELVLDALGQDLFNQLVYRPFAEWTTEEMETLAKRVDEIYTDGKATLQAKKDAQIEQANRIRENIERAVKNTGIVINPGDSEEVKQKKREQIAKILGEDVSVKGTIDGKRDGLFGRLGKILHGYSDANVLRVARILDGYQDGTNVIQLYRRENDCYIAKNNAINQRTSKINQAMKDNKIKLNELFESVEIKDFYKGESVSFTVDELLFFMKASLDEKAKEAVMYGNMMSGSVMQKYKQKFINADEQAQTIDMVGEDLPGTHAYKEICEMLFDKVLTAANSLDKKYLNFADAISDDYAIQFDRLQEASVNEFNTPVWRENNYIPLVRLESNGDTNHNRVKEDLLGTLGGGTQTKQWADKGMTKKRIKISPLYQAPVETGLYKTWVDSVERTEHFIAYAGYVRELNRVYKSKDARFTRRFIEDRYGKGMVDYIDNYINEVANPNANAALSDMDRIVKILRGRTAPAYLAWKTSSIVKQSLTSPWPFIQFMNPAQYLKSCFDILTKKNMYETIQAKSVFMRNRKIDPIIDLIDEQLNKKTNPVMSKVNQFNKIGMTGLEMIDWVCVAPGWLAAYEERYKALTKKNDDVYEITKAQLQEENDKLDIVSSERMTEQQIETEAQKAVLTESEIEAKAVEYADDVVRQCQPSNRSVDLAPLFKQKGPGSEIIKAVLQFQTSLNVIWQNIRYDIPMAVRQKEFKKVVGTIGGYVMAGIMMNAVCEGFGGDDGEDDEATALKKLIFYSTTQFTDAIPVIGSYVTRTTEQLITGETPYSTNNDLFPLLTKYRQGTQQAIKGNWDKAAGKYVEALGLTFGAPVSGVKELLDVVSNEDGEDGLHFESLIGR